MVVLGRWDQRSLGSSGKGIGWDKGGMRIRLKSHKLRETARIPGTLIDEVLMTASAAGCPPEGRALGGAPAQGSAGGIGTKPKQYRGGQGTGRRTFAKNDDLARR